MKKISIAMCMFVLLTLFFTMPVIADEPNVIKLSELEDGQELEINDKDTILEIDTDKTLSGILVNNCDLTITGNGTLKVIDNDYSITWCSNSIRNDSGSINIIGGHIECERIEGEELTISDDLFVLRPWNEVPYEGRSLIGGSYTRDGVYYSGIRIVPKDEIVNVEGISFEEPSYTIDKLNSFYPKVKFYPENASNQKLNWESSDNSILFTCDGCVNSVDYGTATVTVTSEDGNFTASCEVTIPKPEPREDKGIRIELKERPYIDNIKIDGENLEKDKDYFIRYNDETGNYDLILENFGRKN